MFIKFRSWGHSGFKLTMAFDFRFGGASRIFRAWPNTLPALTHHWTLHALVFSWLPRWLGSVLWRMWLIKSFRQNPQVLFNFSCCLVHRSPYLIIHISPPISKTNFLLLKPHQLKCSLHTATCLTALWFLCEGEKCEVNSFSNLTAFLKIDMNKLGVLGTSHSSVINNLFSHMSKENV